jgi:hypothetical protein
VLERRILQHILLHSPPPLQNVDNRKQPPAGLGEAVVHPPVPTSLSFPMHDPHDLKLPELIDEHFVRDTRDSRLQLIESPIPSGEETQDRGNPLEAKDSQGEVNGRGCRVHSRSSNLEHIGRGCPPPSGSNVCWSDYLDDGANLRRQAQRTVNVLESLRRGTRGFEDQAALGGWEKARGLGTPPALGRRKMFNGDSTHRS